MEAEAFLNELPTVIFSAIKDSSNLLDRFLLPSLASSSTLSKTLSLSLSCKTKAPLYKSIVANYGVLSRLLWYS
jgi:hypothetical protein